MSTPEMTEEGPTAQSCLAIPDSASSSEKLCFGHGCSASSLPAGYKVHFHGVHKGTAIAKHTHGRGGLGRASKLAHLEVAAAEHIGHAFLTSPRLLRSPGRKKSPIRWFPRKKTESYLERKIRMLQVKEGNVASLDETLGAANLHLSRIEREKLAAQAAAAEAIDARKAALVEASWCRILKLAGIPCKVAISELQNAEKKAAAALAEAENHGVILQLGTADQRESASEAVTAPLETALDVDKEVTAAIKTALQQLRQSSERACDLQDETDVEFTSLEAMTSCYTHDATDSQSDTETKGDCKCEEQPYIPLKDSCLKSCSNNAEESNAQHSLVNLMKSRIRELSVEHHTALAGIVATHGLSALLKDQSLEQELNGRTSGLFDSKLLDEGCSPKKSSDLGSILMKPVSRTQREVHASKEISSNLQQEVEKRAGGRLQKPVAHVDSLDQILVKHVSKLEKEKLAAQATRRTPPKKKSNSVSTEETSSLAELLSKRHEHSETGKQVKEESQIFNGGGRKKLIEFSKTPFCTGDLGNILIKPVSMLEKEKQTALRMQESKDVQNADLDRGKLENVGTNNSSTPETTKVLSYTTQSQDSNEIPDLGSILVKHVSRLEKEKQMALALQDKSNTPGRRVERGKQSREAGLGDILVKRLSKLEIEKARLSGSGIRPTEEGRMEELDSKENSCLGTMSENLVTQKEENLVTGQSLKATWQRDKAQESTQMNSTWSALSLQDALSSAKSMSTQINTVNPLNGNIPRRKSLREKQMEDAWGGLSLGNALKPHVSKLEKEQAAWKRAEEEARQRQR